MAKAREIPLDDMSTLKLENIHLKRSLIQKDLDDLQVQQNQILQSLGITVNGQRFGVNFEKKVLTIEEETTQ